MTTTSAKESNTPLDSQLKALNVRPSEYDLICRGLGREPNFTELCMFSALWSEHCAYKHSRHLLKTLPTQGPAVLQGPGENAGIIDCGDGFHVAFKVESHNHPTYVEPFQGAATGVGGILRDIITMNARPIANLNALRFGELHHSPQASENRRRLKGAVAGIAHYGNCMGIPTIGGDLFIHPSYAGNPLVNAMAIGLMEAGGIMPAGAQGVGNPVLYVGSPTGKDGMGGASFASKALDENASASDRPAVQVGDPFAEKCLMEACLEAFATGLVVSAQDMGAAGLTCATAEMAAKGDKGMRIDLDLVPAREAHMHAWEYLSSESQERFLFVLEKGQEAPVLDIFKKWQVPAVIIGEVLEEERIEVWHHGEKIVDVPAKLLTDDAPTYPPDFEVKESSESKARRLKLAQDGLSDLRLAEVPNVLESLMAAANIADRYPIYEQYDRHVKLNTHLTSDHNTAGLIRLHQPNKAHSLSGPASKALAATLDGNPLHVWLNPYEGSKGIVAEALRNIVCTGATPLAVTNNLNFGNPETPLVAFQLAESVRGIKDACLAFKTPVTGGNVSLYNTNGTEAILPSPTLGMVGVLEDVSLALTPVFKQAGDVVAILGRFAPSLGGSVYQAQQTGHTYGEPPTVDLETEARLANFITQVLVPKRLFNSLQDVSSGGLLPTLVESCFGFRALSQGVSLDVTALVQAVERLDVACFGETHGTYLLSATPDAFSTLETLTQDAGLALIRLGHTQSAEKGLALSCLGESVRVDLARLLQAYTRFIV
jgi:phosphoribosylformylglycinamidine synthase